MLAVALIAALAIVGVVLIGVNALNQLRNGQERIHESELQLRTHLQAQVDDLHAKVLAHNWEEYGNTVGQRSAFDRAVAAEAERQPSPLGDSPRMDESLEQYFNRVGEELEEGPVVG